MAKNIPIIPGVSRGRLSNLEDVDISSPSNGDALKYNSTTGKWESGSVSSSCSSSDVIEAVHNFKGIWWHMDYWGNGDHFTIGNTGGGISTNIDGRNALNLYSGSSSGNWARIYRKTYYNVQGDFSKNRKLKVRVNIVRHTNQIIWITGGGLPTYNSEADTSKHIGFKVIDNKLYGTVADGSNESTLLLETLTSDDNYRELDFVFTAGSQVEFFVDGVSKGTINTNLPSGTDGWNIIFLASIYTKEAANKDLYISLIDFIQEE